VIFSITKFHAELSRAPADLRQYQEARRPIRHTGVVTLATPFEPSC